MWKISFLQALELGFESAQMALLDSHVEVAEFEVALDRKARDTFPHDFVAGPAQFAEEFVDLPAVMPGDSPFTRDAADKLAAISSRCSPAHPIGFHDVHVIATLGQRECCRYAGESGAYDAHVRRFFARQRVEIGNLIDSSGVVRIRVLCQSGSLLRGQLEGLPTDLGSRPEREANCARRQSVRFSLAMVA